MLRGFSIAMLLLGAVCAPSASARAHHRHHRSPPRRIVAPRTPASGHSGFVTVSSASATGAIISGLPLDTHQIPITVSASKPMHVDTTGGTIYATAALCGSRPGCTNVAAGNAYNTAPPSFIRPGDTLLLVLNVTSDVATAALSSGSTVPSIVIYDFG